MLPCLAALGRSGKTQFRITHSRRGRHFAFPQRVKFLDTFKEGVRRPLALRDIIPCEKLTSLIFMLVRACVHYALFEDTVNDRAAGYGLTIHESTMKKAERRSVLAALCHESQHTDSTVNRGGYGGCPSLIKLRCRA